MITVEVRSLSYIKEHIGKNKFKYSFHGPKTVYELLNDLDEEYSLGEKIYNKDGKISDNITLILRGKNVAFLKTEELMLREGDIVLIMPALGGG